MNTKILSYDHNFFVFFINIIKRMFKVIFWKTNIYHPCIQNNSKFNFAVAAKVKAQKTLYQILQLPSTSPQSNIRKNYLKLAKIFHPDVYKGSDKGRFQLIKKAYETLSDVRKRQQYDQQIGIKAKSPQSVSNQFQGTSTNQSGQQLNKQNNFTYQKAQQQTINIDEQYQKFFKKKKQTDFQQIRLHEQTQFRQMNQQQRMRFRFRQLYTNDAAQLKNNQTKSYQDLLDDQIGQRNDHHQDIKKKKEKIDKMNSEQGIRKQKIIVYTLAVIGAIIFYPLFFSFWTKYRLEQQQKQKIMDLMQQMKQKANQADVRSRFQY